MAGTEYFNETAQPRDHIPLNTMRKSQSHTVTEFAALIRLSTTTHNLLTFNKSQRSSNNSKKPRDFSLTLVLFKFPDL